MYIYLKIQLDVCVSDTRGAISTWLECLLVVQVVRQVVGTHFFMHIKMPAANFVWADWRAGGCKPFQHRVNGLNKKCNILI